MAEDQSRQRPAGTEHEPEPEGGPFEREREFVEERFAKLRRKNARGHLESVVIEPGQDPTTESGDDPLPADYRRKKIEQFRERQRHHIPTSEESADSDAGPPDAPDAPATPNLNESERPEPPQAPPANNWIPIGPSILRQGQGGVMPATSGRTPGIAVAPGGTVVYIASHNGGIWRSDDTGESWRSLMDAFDLNPTTLASDSLACGAVAIDPGNVDRVYVGTGEGASSGSAFNGVGPLVGLSTDGGLTFNWTTEPVAPGSQDLGGSAFFSLAVDPTDPERVVAATRRGVYRREPSGAGFHWSQKTMGGMISQVVSSVVMAHSGGTTTWYAARQNGPIFSSTDGDTWVQAGTGFPANAGRISLAVQEGNPNVVYALTASETVFRLDIADGTWRQITGVPSGFLGSQGWYDLAIAVAPNNVNRVILGGSTIFDNGDWSGSVYRCDVTVSGMAVSMTSTYIGGSVHADIHTIVFTPNDANKLWVGCDGGVFYSTNPNGSGNIFVHRNTGLQTLSMNYLALHPTEDAVLFAGTQDNGGIRYTGEEAWLYSSGGDGGFAEINWNDPYRVLSTYVRGSIRRSTDGGSRYSYSNVNVPLAAGEQALFYAPIAGTPANFAAPAEADIVAFGSIRPWISTNFGTSWQSIPNNTLAGDSLDDRIKSLCFASATKLYAGTMAGGVYRFDKSGANWTRTQIDTLGGSNQLTLAGPVTDISIDHSDATGNSIFITFGGSGDYRHVWRFNGTQWQQRSGPSANDLTSLLDVQANAIVTDPANPDDVYLGADIGIWRSTNGGANWETFSQGLPDTAVLDLKLHAGRRLLRAATHGRSTFERTLDTTPKQGVELYIRDTQLDQGRFTTVNFLPDPTQQGQTVRHWRGPDIKLDTPDTNGQYQFPLTGDITFHQFADTLVDDTTNVATHATATITTRVYVQVHNRGVLPANNVQVMLLLANASAGLPALPAGYTGDVQTGTAITSANWQTIGAVTLNDIRVGFPKIAAFNLTSDKLPPPANLAGNNHHCVLALLHHADDPFTNTETNTDNLSLTERKSAHKNLTVVQFTGTLPVVSPLIIPIRLNNATRELLLTDLVINLSNYRGATRLYIPPLETDGRFEDVLEGLKIDEDFRQFHDWAATHVREIKANQRSRHPYNRQWTEQRIADIQQALVSGLMLRAGGRSRVALRRVAMRPDSYHTVFLMLDRPRDGEIGESFDVEVLQLDSKRREVIGGQDIRVDLVPKPIHVEEREAEVSPIQHGTQFTGLIAGNRTSRWFSHSWPADWHVVWTVVPTTIGAGGPQISWQVQVERKTAEYVTYWISVTNHSADPVEVEGRFDVLSSAPVSLPVGEAIDAITRMSPLEIARGMAVTTVEPETASDFVLAGSTGEAVLN